MLEVKTAADTEALLDALRRSLRLPVDRNDMAALVADHFAAVLELVPERDRQNVSRRAAGLLARQRVIDRPGDLLSRLKLRPLRGDAAFQDLVAEVRQSGRTLLDDLRLWVLWQALQATAPLDLPSIEIGAYKGGGSAFIISAYQRLRATARTHHVVDPFEGHQAADITGQDLHEAGMFANTSFESVRAFLQPMGQVLVHKGRFIDVVPVIEGPIGFIHLDTDLFEPTLHALRVARERMPPGGVVLVDDYAAGKCPGVAEAVKVFAREADGSFSIWESFTEQAVLIRTTAA